MSFHLLIRIRYALAFGAAALFLGACAATAPIIPPRPSVAQEAQGKSPPAPVAMTGTDISASAEVIRDEVEIAPEGSIGFENLPTTITQIFEGEPFDLSLYGAVAETFANNRAISIAGYTMRIAEFEIPVSKGIYDLLLGSTAGFTRTEEQTNPNQEATFRARSARTRAAEVFAEQLLPSGAILRLANSMVRSAVQSISTPDSVVTDYTSRTTLEARQPLLRGLGPAVTNATIRIAQLEHHGAAADFQTRVEEILVRVLETYWALIGFLEDYKVKVISYSAARDLLRVNKAKFDVGRVPMTDVLQAEAAAEVRREEIIRTRQTVRDLEDELKRLIFLQPDNPNWDRQVRPSQPLAWREIEVDLDQTIDVALDQRPELRRAQSNIEQDKVNLRVAKNAILPALDLVGSVDSNGVDGDLDGGFRNHKSGRFSNYSIALEFSYPLQNRAARYRRRQAQAGLQQSEEILLDLRDQITLEVRQAARALKTARERIDVTQATVRSEAEKLRSERLRFDVGTSTAFQVLEFQEDLANAQSQHLRAVVDFNLAAIRLERARGTLLKTYGVSLAADEVVSQSEPVLFPIGFN